MPRWDGVDSGGGARSCVEGAGQREREPSANEKKVKGGKCGAE